MAANKACTATHHNSLLSRNNLMLDTIRRRHAHRFSFYWFFVNGVSPVIQISKQTPQYISSLCTEWSGRSEWLAAARSCCNTCTSPNSSPPSSFECSPAPFGSAHCLYCSPSRPATSTPHSPIPRPPSEYPLRCRLQNQYRANGPAYHWYPPTPAPELHVNKVSRTHQQTLVPACCADPCPSAWSDSPHRSSHAKSAGSCAIKLPFQKEAYLAWRFPPFFTKVLSQFVYRQGWDDGSLPSHASTPRSCSVVASLHDRSCALTAPPTKKYSLYLALSPAIVSKSFCILLMLFAIMLSIACTREN